ncbi:hypothetical protein K501DRAFT_272290 [Backusella circina FSU 941]|nr:hypothetical protein K501DRAFT_272290 [Backusella circina FSU 941]
MIDTTTSATNNTKNNNSIIWDATVGDNEHKNDSESESENEWTDIVVTKQGGLHTKTRKIQDDLEEPNWDKKVDDVVWEEDDESTWKTKNSRKAVSSTSDLTKMKDWAKEYSSTQDEEKEDEEQIPPSATKTSTAFTISPITALTKSHPSTALIPKYQNHHKELIIKVRNNKQLVNLPLLTRSIRKLKHSSIISDCATELYSTDSYLFIASCTFGILIFRSPVI